VDGRAHTDMDTVYTTSRLPGSVRNLQRYSGRSEREVKKFLAGQDSYTLQNQDKVVFLDARAIRKELVTYF